MKELGQKPPIAFPKGMGGILSILRIYMVCMSRYGKQNVMHVLMAEAALKFALTPQTACTIGC
jgi:hypothetical protein